MRKSIVAGNWKMNLNWNEAKSLVEKLNAAAAEMPEDVSVIISPPAPYLAAMADLVDPKFRLAAQNCNENESGAFTGEHSAGMLCSIHVTRCIIGHSERRAQFGETDEVVSKKAKACLDAGVTPIICFGENLSDRENEKHFDVVKRQVEVALSKVEKKSLANLILAYEPVWAIGTGKTASPKQVQEMHAAIRDLIAEKSDQMTADIIPILYGGSVKPDNAKEIFSSPDVDGGLIGGASLKAEDFIAIINAAS